MKLNSDENYDAIMVSLNPETYPIAFTNRVESLIQSGFSPADADREARQPIELELYYDEASGLFGVESDAVDQGATIINPYTGEALEAEDE